MAKIFVGADHRGFELKEKLRECFPEMQDMGRGYGEFAGDDYNEPARKVAEKILANEDSFGVLICGTGVGMSIQANRFPGVRAVLARSVGDARAAREHNDANVLCLGADETDFSVAVEIVREFLEAKFLGEARHQRRNDKLDIGCFYGENYTCHEGEKLNHKEEK